MPIPRPWTVERITSILIAPRARTRPANEAELQDAIETLLLAAGAPVQREVRLDLGGLRTGKGFERIDFTVGRIGIEVKKDGAVKDVRAQLARYADADALDRLVLITTLLRHKMPDTLGGKPVTVINLWGGVL